ncbi:MAG: cytochrome c [Pseudomonadota bacterium]
MKTLYRMSLLLGLLFSSSSSWADRELVERGHYIFDAAGCGSCHAGVKPLTGGRPIETPFGTFYTPNITPHREYGIGAWSEADFIRALRDGKSPNHEHYFPAYPYTSFTDMTREDMSALYAYLMTQPAYPVKNRPHDLPGIFGSRRMVAQWKLANFRRGPFRPDRSRSRQWNRGAYLVNALGHCGECHTPRGVLGGMNRSRHLAGNRKGPGGIPVPNITPERNTGIGHWKLHDLFNFFDRGVKPDGASASGRMAEVLGTSSMRLTPADKRAIAVYLKSLPPVRNDVYSDVNPFTATGD